MFEIAAFHRFTPLPDPASLRLRLQAVCDAAGLKGILLVASEGINGTLAGAPAALREAMQAIARLTGIHDLQVRTAQAPREPFLRLKVRLKTEIVTIGDPTVDPRERTGIEVEPEDWNALIRDPDVLVIDTRNAFEVAIGSFDGAHDPRTVSFGDFPAFAAAELDPTRHRKIAMFCTGGIRCEKASSFLLREGFGEVYQLKGGILNYLETMPADRSLWRGDCFVFDGRVAVGHGLVPSTIATCFACRHPLTADDQAVPAYEAGVSCPHCAPAQTPAQKASARERHRQVLHAEARGAAHLGPMAQHGAASARNRQSA